MNNGKSKHHKHAPSQDPTSFAMMKPHAGSHNHGPKDNVPDQLRSGPQREKVLGHKK